MKKTLFSIMMLALSLCAFAQHVSYSYKPLAAEGCNVRFSAVYQDGIPYLFVEVRSDRLVFGDSPTLKLKFKDGEIISVLGQSLSSSEEHAGIMIGNIMAPVTEIKARAQFQLTEEQVKSLNKGVSKIRLSTVPLVHEREFKSDKIGKKLFSNRKKITC